MQNQAGISLYFPKSTCDLFSKLSLLILLKAVLKYGSLLFKNDHFLDEAGHVEKHVGTLEII